MRVKALKDFPVIIDGEIHEIKKGDEFNVPITNYQQMEWIWSSGFVVPVREKKIETVVMEPQERAITR